MSRPILFTALAATLLGATLQGFNNRVEAGDRRDSAQDQAKGPAKHPRPQGPLVIVGGGGTPPAARAAFLSLAGPKPLIVVLPQASSTKDRGQSSAQMWREAGAQKVLVSDPIQREDLLQADGIWFSGGSQLDLMQALRDADLVELLTERSQAGVVIGGTSAGAAVMGTHMIAGSPDPGPYRHGAMDLMQGLALWPKVIVDQHFAERHREGRLLSAVLDAPSHFGVGISERTAILLQDGKAQVMYVSDQGI